MTVITLDLPANGDTAFVDKYNAALTTIATTFNGGIDQNNIADNSIIATKILDGAVGTAKLTDLAVTTAKLAAASVTAAKIEAQQAWQAPVYQNSWQNYDTTFEAGGYYKDSLGYVHLKGMVKLGVIGTAIFTLPAGYRPLKNHLFMVNSNSAVGRVDVSTAGVVTATVGNNTFVSLSGISFRAEA